MQDKGEKFAAANVMLFSVLAVNTTGRARDIVKEHRRDGAAAWLRLKERFGKTSGATTFSEVFAFPWKQVSTLEDIWMAWTKLVGRLPPNGLSDEALETLTVNGIAQAGHRELEQHLRLLAPQNWKNFYPI